MPERRNTLTLLFYRKNNNCLTIIQTLSNGKTVEYGKEPYASGSFTRAVRFNREKVRIIRKIIYIQQEMMGMIGQTDFKVGPGTYKPETSLDRLKAKPCMAKMQPSVILREDCYEVVNNIKVLQPKYLKESERKMLNK